MAKIRMYTTTWCGYCVRAKALLDSGDLTEAERAATRGLASNPDTEMVPLGHYVLADICSRQGREAEAANHAAAGRRAERDGSRAGHP